MSGMVAYYGAFEVLRYRACPKCLHLMSVHVVSLETIAPDRVAAFLRCKALPGYAPCSCAASWRTSP